MLASSIVDNNILLHQPRPNPVLETFNRQLHQPKCSTTIASINLSNYLKDVMTILKHKDDGLFKAHGIRRCWFVQSTDQVFFEIKQNLSHLRNFKPSTYDFTTMYTKMQHDHILHNIQRSIQEAHQY